MADYSDNRTKQPGVESPLILEIRERFTYCVDSLSDIREEAKKDMKYISGDPWDAKERKAREDASRPCLSVDELNQYVNQLMNDVRQNKRAVKVTPRGAGANDKTAELRASIIREIEYKSTAQSAYSTAFENAITRSYGHWRVTTQYMDDVSFDQEIRIKRIPNPDTVYIDPNCKEADNSDMEYAFIVEPMKKKEFKRKYPKALITDFSSEHMEAAPLWIQQDSVLRAEYWKVEKTHSKLEIEGRKREVEHHEVIQYITNGIEILETNKWSGKYIPIVTVYGREIFVDKGKGSERILMSLIRLARDPQMLYAYYRSNQAEIVGMTPKTPYIGYEGQFTGHEEEWENVNKQPIAYLQVAPTMDATGAQVLPLPQRQLYEPPIQALEMGAESSKRAIQSAMGRYNTSVGRSDTKATSGVAIRALDQQSDQGSYHFIDNYDRALEYNGRIINDLIPLIYDTPRELGIRKPDDSFTTAKINQEYQNPDTGEMIQQMLGDGEHDVTISTGPSFQSQREEADVFLETLASVQMQNTLFPRVADLAIKAKQLGPIGDEMAKRLVPPEFASQEGQEPIPPQVKAMLQKLKQEVQAINAYAKKLEEELKQLQSEKQAKIIDIQSKERIAAMNNQTQILITESKIRGEAMVSRLQGEIDAINKKLERELGEALDKPSPGEAE